MTPLKKIRIRSSMFILEYPKNDLTLEEMKNFLKKVLKISSNDNSEWEYLIKSESYHDNSSKILIFINLKIGIDIYLNKLIYRKKVYCLEPNYWSVIDKTLALKYILKSSNKCEYLTNINKQIIQNNTSFL